MANGEHLARSHIKLAHGRGVTLTELSPSALLVEADGEAPLVVPLRAVGRYRDATVTRLRASPTLWRVLCASYDVTRKSIRSYQLSAIIGRGADLRATGKGRVGVHHCRLVTLDDRAENLRTVRTSTHNAWHAWIDRLQPTEREEYLASLADTADGLGKGLPRELRAAIEADLRELEVTGGAP